MAKYCTADDDVQNLVHEVAAELNLENFMDFEALYVPKAKEVVTVSKASAIAEYLSKRDDLILVFVFADIFEQYEEKDKYMAIRSALEQISVNYETGKITIGCPMVTVPLGLYQTLGKPVIDNAVLGQVSIAQWEEKKKQEKEEKKSLRTKKK